ncbi:uncharacterized protein METZ01_LOCUS399387, partial [marine metagenome]
MLLTMVIILSYLIPEIRGGEKAQYELHFDRFLVPPCFEFPFGTDSLGRDLLSVTFMGARASFMVGIGVVALAIIIGLPIGMVAGYY